jgi:hypothetical protein
MAPEMSDAQFWAQFDQVRSQDDAQEFLQVSNLGATMVRVWFRELGPDFMASCKVVHEGKRRGRDIRAVGSTRKRALERLASAVAEFHYPTTRASERDRLFAFERPEDVR